MLTGIELSQSFTDVVYLAGQAQQAPPEIKRLLKQRKLSSFVLSVDEFSRIRDRLDLIGTVVIDPKDMSKAQHQKLARIIEILEMENVGVILLAERVETPVKSFSLAPAKSSFSLGGTVETVSIDDLWVRISVNLESTLKR